MNPSILQPDSTDDLQDNPYVKARQNRLDTMSQEYVSMIVGEQKNIKLGICAIVSRSLPKNLRFSLMVLNQTATGKSHFINTLLEPIRKTGDVIDFTDFTEAYLKRKFTDVNGKIFKIEQAENRDDKGKISLGRIKHLQTEGNLAFGLADKNEKGKTVAKEFEVKGFPIIFTTVTDQNIDPETENRFLIVELDESEEQTKRIVRHQLVLFSGLHDGSWNVSKIAEHYTEFKKISPMIKDIVVPFTNEIESIIPAQLHIRRDLPRIMALTCIIAFINYKNRDKLMMNKAEHLLTSMYGDTELIHKAVIVATVDDFNEAVDIAGSSINKSLNKISQKTHLIFQKLKELSNKKGLDNVGVTIKELQSLLNMPESTIRLHLNILKENGYVLRDEDSGKEYKFYPQNKPISNIQSSIVFSDQSFQKWIEQYLDKNKNMRFLAVL